MADDVDAARGVTSSLPDDWGDDDRRLSPRAGAELPAVASAATQFAGTDGEEITGEPHGPDISNHADDHDKPHLEPGHRRASGIRPALAAALMIVVTLAGLVGWLSYRTCQSRHAEAQRDVFLQMGRQVALNMSTIDAQNADADVQRILDSATGGFHDEFQRHSQAFVQVIKQAQSKSEGTVTEAGVESEQANAARVLLAVRVKTSAGGTGDQQPHAWRMRVDLQKVGDSVKVSNVEFMP